MPRVSSSRKFCHYGCIATHGTDRGFDWIIWNLQQSRRFARVRIYTSPDFEYWTTLVYTEYRNITSLFGTVKAVMRSFIMCSVIVFYARFAGISFAFCIGCSALFSGVPKQPFAWWVKRLQPSTAPLFFSVIHYGLFRTRYLEHPAISNCFSLPLAQINRGYLELYYVLKKHYQLFVNFRDQTITPAIWRQPRCLEPRLSRTIYQYPWEFEIAGFYCTIHRSKLLRARLSEAAWHFREWYGVGRLQGALLEIQHSLVMDEGVP